MEDLDTQRTSFELANDTMEDLRWLGLTWGYGPDIPHDSTQYFQSKRSSIYIHFFEQLKEMGFAYPYSELGLDAPKSWEDVRKNSEIIYNEKGIAGFAFDSYIDLAQYNGPLVKTTLEEIIVNTF